VRFAARLVLMAALAACQPATEPSDSPSFTGSIVARDVRISIGGPPTIHVKETESAECGVIFLVTDSTPIVRREANGRRVSVSVSELTVGRRVAVWTDVVMESCPGQAAAHFVELLES